MAKVLCKLPNASTNINGVRFVTHRDGMISEEVDDAVALALSEINGYEIYDPGQTDPVAAAVLEASRKGVSPVTRVGPSEPHPDMVICPACTSQFPAIPANIQSRLSALEKTAAATPPVTPPPVNAQKAAAAGKAKPTPPAATGAGAPPSETPPADGKPATASDPTF